MLPLERQIYTSATMCRTTSTPGEHDMAPPAYSEGLVGTVTAHVTSNRYSYLGYWVARYHTRGRPVSSCLPYWRDHGS